MSGVVVVDAGGANIASVRYALQRLGVDAALSHDAATIRAASHVILPGVGAAAPAMRRLNDLDLVEVLRDLKQPVLGVCLGMQLLFARSEESDVACLDLIADTVTRFPHKPGLRVPHMGWNSVSAARANALLDDGDDYAYFVHSYLAPVGDYTLATCSHGVTFSAMVQRENFFGVQFHPERSSALGARVLKNFLTL